MLAEEIAMRKGLLCAALASAFLVMGTAVQSAMPKLDRPVVDKLVEPVVCVGNRRTYRNFNHCWRVNKRNSAGYCSRICPKASRR
jgi:hypothetical protein